MQFTRKDFLKLAGSLPLAAATACATSVSSFATEQGLPETADRTLIKGADILAMSHPDAEHMKTDVLIEKGRITAIGKDLPSAGASIIDATGMILMPGLIDGHRHVWQTLLNGQLPKISPRYSQYDRLANMTYALAFEPDDMYTAQYLGGLACIDAGVTSVIDQMHAANGDEMEDAAARGLLASGVAGVFCYQLRNGPYYTVGDTYTHAQALADRSQPADKRHWQNAERIRDRRFTGDNVLHFGIGLSGSVGTQTVEQAAAEFHRARALSPKMLTQHMNQRAGTQPPILRGVADLQAAGLLGPDYLISHGVDVTDEEIAMLRDAGSGICSTVMGEFPYAKPSIHGRAREIGANACIGIDVSIALPHDYFEHIRAAYWNLFRSERGDAIARTMEPFDVLDLATRMGARAIGFGDEVGTIETGKRADLILLRTDRLAFSQAGSLADRVVTSATQGDVDTVMIAGKVKKSAGKLTGIDQATLALNAERARENVLLRAERITLK